MRLYLMRHGETDWNTKGLIQGSTDVPLNENGRKLAEMTREGFLSEGIAFTRIFASPLVRAHETAKIVAGKDCSIQIETDDRIREMSFGRYEGVSIRETGINPVYANINNFFVKPKSYVPEEGCESYEDAENRIRSFCEEKLFPISDETKSVLVVCHGAIIRSFLKYLLNIKPDELWDIRQPNCCVNIFEIAYDSAKVIELAKLFYDEEFIPKRKYT